MAVVFISACALIAFFVAKASVKHEIIPPVLKNNPNFDVVVTETTPLLSFLNAKGGLKVRNYDVEISKSKDFDRNDTICFKKVRENGEFVTSVKIDERQPLNDNCQYFWRARANCPSGAKSDWATSRFFVDTHSDDEFMQLARAEIKNIEVSGGYNAKNIIDYDDPGLVTFWQSPPPGAQKQWVLFDLGNQKEISRAWILSNINDQSGWLKDFHFEWSDDNKKWQDIPNAKKIGNDTFRNIIDFKPVKARYIKLIIDDFIGYAAQINEVILYTPSQPSPPKIPNSDYVLIIGNEHNGFTFTALADHIESLNTNLKTVTVPYFQASLAMLDSLSKKPVAIILSGNNADYPNLPMFEHNGEFEIIRESKIPILGICAGHQFLAMAYGYTRARSMGWSDISALEPKRKMTRVHILEDDPIFEGIEDNFIAPEIHGWAVVEPAPEFEVVAKSTYIQAQRSMKRMIYGIQFHSEIDEEYNQGKKVIENFLKLALRSAESDKHK